MSILYTCPRCEKRVIHKLHHYCWSEPKPAGDGVNDDTAAIASAIYSGKDITVDALKMPHVGRWRISQPADDWKPDERTVKTLIDALPPALHSGKESVHFDVYEYRVAARKALKAFLAKPNPTKALMEAFTSDTTDAGGSEVVKGDHRWILEHYTRWLIENDRIK
jgi:hypothetical protein